MWRTHEGCAQTLSDCSSLFTHHGAVCIWLCGADAALWWVGDPARWRIRRAKCEIKQQMKACSLQRQNPAAVRAGKYVWFSDPGCNHTHYWVPFQSMFQLWASCLFKSKRKRSHFDHFRSFGWMSRVFWCFWRLKSQLMSDLRRWRWRERFFPHHQTTYVNHIWKLYPVICPQRAFSFPFFLTACNYRAEPIREAFALKSGCCVPIRLTCMFPSLPAWKRNTDLLKHFQNEWKKPKI